jgi:thiosulfate dehydrogenase (quinone) large subunit
MFQAYFESIKYVGHLLPISFLRIFLGYFYIDLAIKDWKFYSIGNGGLADLFVEALNKPALPSWYRLLLSEHIIPNWQTFAFILIGLQFAVGISYILGYVVRPTSLLAVFVCLNYLSLKSVDQEIFFKLLIACHILLAWVGAGRCLGIDYYFFKRRRGMWW